MISSNVSVHLGMLAAPHAAAPFSAAFVAPHAAAFARWHAAAPAAKRLAAVTSGFQIRGFA